MNSYKKNTISDNISVINLVEVYHYWVEGEEGKYESENATVVTSLAPHTAIFDQLEESNAALVLRPELNCLLPGEDGLSNALLDHYLFPPPPSSQLLRQFTIEEAPQGSLGGSARNVLQDQFLDEFIFKGKVKDGFFVEAGADEFLLNSNTLLFELLHGWTGLLVEPIASRFNQG